MPLKPDLSSLLTRWLRQRVCGVMAGCVHDGKSGVSVRRRRQEVSCCGWLVGLSVGAHMSICQISPGKGEHCQGSVEFPNWRDTKSMRVDQHHFVIGCEPPHHGQDRVLLDAFRCEVRVGDGVGVVRTSSFAIERYVGSSFLGTRVAQSVSIES